MYYKTYIPENEKVENMSVAELYSAQSWHYHNTFFDFDGEERCVLERLAYIQDQTHT